VQWQVRFGIFNNEAARFSRCGRLAQMLDLGDERWDGLEGASVSPSHPLYFGKSEKLACLAVRGL
jgi:hypothetical protein